MRPTRDPFQGAVDRFLDYLRDQRHVSDCTLRAYTSDLEQFHQFLIDRDGVAPEPEGLDVLAIRGFVAHLGRSGLAKSSIARKLSAVRSFLRHAVRDGRMEVSPAEGIPTPRVPRPLPRDMIQPAPLRSRSGNRMGVVIQTHYTRTFGQSEREVPGSAKEIEYVLRGPNLGVHFLNQDTIQNQAGLAK